MDGIRKAALYRQALLKEVRELAGRGIEIVIDGVEYEELNQEEVCVVRENESYMKSFTGDSNGKIIQVEFTKIRDIRK